jgi:hypothetical protein
VARNLGYQETLDDWPIAKIQFGRLEPIGSLTLAAHLANRLARAASGQWPELGPFPAETRGETLRRLFSQWALLTGMAALFFTLAPLLAAPHGPRPPIYISLLFPAMVFGMVAMVRYIKDREEEGESSESV